MNDFLWIISANNGLCWGFRASTGQQKMESHPKVKRFNFHPPTVGLIFLIDHRFWKRWLQRAKLCHIHLFRKQSRPP
jgi:hypothetical protein